MKGVSYSPVAGLGGADPRDKKNSDLEQFETLVAQNVKVTKNIFGKSCTAIDLSSGELRVDDVARIQGYLESVRKLDLSNNCLAEFGIGEYAKKLSRLRTLYLDNNEISRLCLRGMTKLKVLSISSNRLSDLPSFDDQSRLESLNISNNRILRGWRELGKLKGLKWLDVSSCGARMVMGEFERSVLRELRSLPRLRWLFIDGSFAVDDEPSQLEALILQSLPKLLWLNGRPVKELAREPVGTCQGVGAEQGRWPEMRAREGKRCHSVSNVRQLVSASCVGGAPRVREVKEERLVRFEEGSRVELGGLPGEREPTPAVDRVSREERPVRVERRSSLVGLEFARECWEEVEDSARDVVGGMASEEGGRELMARVDGDCQSSEQLKRERLYMSNICWAAKPEVPLDLSFGDYVIQYMVGLGTWGSSWRGIFVSSDGLILEAAIRILESAPPGADRLFGEETERYVRLCHRNLAEVLGVYNKACKMQLRRWVVGTDCGTLLASGGLSEEGRARMVCEVAGAMRYLHSQGVVHGSVSSRNVVLDEEGRAVVTDYGYAGLKSRLKGLECTKEADVGGFGAFVAEVFEMRLGDARSSEGPGGELLEGGAARGEGEKRIRLLVRACGQCDPRRRPSFEEICRYLEERDLGASVGLRERGGGEEAEREEERRLERENREKVQLEISLCRDPCHWRGGAEGRSEAGWREEAGSREEAGLPGVHSANLNAFATKVCEMLSSEVYSTRVIALNVLDRLTDQRRVAHISERAEFLEKLLEPVRRLESSVAWNEGQFRAGGTCVVESTLLALESLCRHWCFTRAVVERGVMGDLVRCVKCGEYELIQRYGIRVIGTICAFREGREALRAVKGLELLVGMLGDAGIKSASLRQVVWALPNLIVEEEDKRILVASNGLSKIRAIFYSASVQVQVHLIAVIIGLWSYEEARRLCEESRFKNAVTRILGSGLDDLQYSALNMLAKMVESPKFVSENTETLFLVKGLINLVPYVSRESILAAYVLEKVTRSAQGISHFKILGGITFAVRYLSSGVELLPVRISLLRIVSRALERDAGCGDILTALNAVELLVPLCMSSFYALSVTSLSIMNRLAEQPKNLEKLSSLCHRWLEPVASFAASAEKERRQFLAMQLLHRAFAVEQIRSSASLTIRCVNEILSSLQSFTAWHRLLALCLLSQLLSVPSHRHFLLERKQARFFQEMQQVVGCLSSPEQLRGAPVNESQLRSALTQVISAAHAVQRLSSPILDFMVRSLNPHDDLLTLHTLRALRSLSESPQNSQLIRGALPLSALKGVASRSPGKLVRVLSEQLARDLGYASEKGARE